MFLFLKVPERKSRSLFDGTAFFFKRLFKFSFFYRNLSVPCGWSGYTTAAAGHFCFYTA
jgi:hypothetical protein